MENAVQMLTDNTVFMSNVNQLFSVN